MNYINIYFIKILKIKLLRGSVPPPIREGVPHSFLIKNKKGFGPPPVRIGRGPSLLTGFPLPEN